MRNLKRALSLTLASVMLLGMMVVGAGAAGYPDVDEEKHDIEAIEVLQAVKVMQGNDKGEFDPDSQVNRSQMAVVMANLLNLDYNYYEASCPFWDVPDWAKPYVAACYANGIVSGYNATTYGAADSVTAVQAASMMMRALGYFKYQEDYDQNGGFELATVKQANQIGLFDGLNANATAALTRNQVAKLALNALEANMVEFTGTPGTSIDLGDGKKVNVGYKAEYSYRTGTEKKYAALSKLGDTTNVIGSGAQGRYYVQLGEELYNGKLTKDDSFDNFDRPTITWKYDYKKIGDYLKDPDVFYTKDVALKDIYKDLGLANAVPAAKVDFYDNGKGEKEVEDDDIYDNSTPGVLLASLGLGKNTGNKIGAKGVLTQVWFYDDTETAIITQVDTCVGKVNTIGNDGKDDRYVTLKSGYTFHTGDVNDLNNKFETADFVAKDLVTFTAAFNYDSGRYDIQSMNTLEVSATGTLTHWEGKVIYNDPDEKGTSTANFTAAGTKYEYSANKKIVDEDEAIVNISDFDVNKSEVNVYLDKYGYAIYVAGVETTKNYAVVIGWGDVNQYGSETRGATLLLPDGTTQEVIAKKPSNVNVSWESYFSSHQYNVYDGNGNVTGTINKNLVGDGEGDLVTYSVGDDGIYTLTIAESGNYGFLTGSYSTDATTPNTTTATSGPRTSFLNGRSLMEIITKYADTTTTVDGNGNTVPVYGTAAMGQYYTTSETIFFVGTQKKPGYPTDGYNYNVYVGYANAPSLYDTIAKKGFGYEVNGIAFVMDKFYTNQINAVYIDADKVAGVSDVDTYFVKQKGATVYTNSDGKYFELPAIVNDEVTTIRIDANAQADWDFDSTTSTNTPANGKERLEALNGGAAGYTDQAGVWGIRNIIRNSKGLITDCEVVPFNAANGTKGGVPMESGDIIPYGVGTVNTRADVLGVGTTEGTAVYWSWRNDVQTFWVDDEYKTITKIDIKDIGTDSNDLVYAMHDDGSPEKKLADVIVVDRANTSTTTYSVLASTGVKFSKSNAPYSWQNTLTGNIYSVAKDANVYVIANDKAYKPTSGFSMTLVGFTAEGQGIYRFKMPGENVPAGSFGTDVTGYALNVSVEKTDGKTLKATATKNSVLTADEAKPGVGATNIVYTFQAEGPQGWTNLQQGSNDTFTNSTTEKNVRVVVTAEVNGVAIATTISQTWTLGTSA